MKTTDESGVQIAWRKVMRIVRREWDRTHDDRCACKEELVGEVC